MKKWTSFERFMVVFLGIVTVVFLTLYSWSATEDRRFEQTGIMTSGKIVGEATCRDGSRFGYQYCYRVRFTTRSGEEVDFSATGRKSYAAGLYILPNYVQVKYLPDQPLHARIVGSERDTGFFLVIGFSGLCITIVIAVSMFFAIRFRKRTNEAEIEQDTLLLNDDFDGAICFTKNISDGVRRKILLGDLVAKLYERNCERKAVDTLSYLLEIFKQESSSFDRDSMLYSLANKLIEVNMHQSASKVKEVIEHKDIKHLIF
ncbi:MAG: DUF3592 domain-containing protein [Halomonas sp.]|nr:DUF3592 domain-containing protein [Halomonas sp.]MCC5904245.1 DUF3592 domain-containing protein [Halomonas sp.]